MGNDAVLSRFSEIESRVESLIARCETVEKERDALQEQVMELEIKIEELTETEKDREQNRVAMEERIDGLLNRLDGFRTAGNQA